MKRLHFMVSTYTILVNNLKSQQWHTRHKRLREIIRNVSPGGEQVWLLMMQFQTAFHFYKRPLPSIPRCSQQGSNTEDTRWINRKMNDISQEIFFIPTFSMKFQHYPVEKLSFLQKNEPLRRRAMIILTSRCIQLRFDSPAPLVASYRIHAITTTEPPSLSLVEKVSISLTMTR